MNSSLRIMKSKEIQEVSTQFVEAKKNVTTLSLELPFLYANWQELAKTENTFKQEEGKLKHQLPIRYRHGIVDFIQNLERMRNQHVTLISKIIQDNCKTESLDYLLQIIRQKKESEALLQVEEATTYSYLNLLKHHGNEQKKLQKKPTLQASKNSYQHIYILCEKLAVLSIELIFVLTEDKGCNKQRNSQTNICDCSK